MNTRVWHWAGLFLMAQIGCFEVPPLEGIRCSRAQTCPEGLTCDPSDNRCRAEVSASCDDNQQNNDETDVDCGGSCPGCADDARCQSGADCQSGVCAGERCAAATCADDVGNGGETGVDCGGGECPRCPEGQGCLGPDDCQSMNCDGDLGECVASGCTDELHNGMETDVDCGGPDCPGCAAGDSCLSASDCLSRVCDLGNTDQCLAPTCDDQVDNGEETDVDCGGPVCQMCSEGESCAVPGDCDTGYCYNNLCTSFPSCQAILLAGLSIGDGPYSIDPDGMGGQPAFTVTCDMTTDGGGWTCIEPVVANGNFGMTMTDLAGTGLCSIDSDRPQGRGTTGINCRFDIDVGFSFDTVRTQAVEIEALSVVGNTSDLTFVDQNWGNIGACGAMGDVHFGTAAHSGAVLSLGRFSGIGACATSLQYADGTILMWDGDEQSTTEDTVLRLELGESGGQDEGWRWAGGCIMVRDAAP